jgi:predicted dehydrogenase
MGDIRAAIIGYGLAGSVFHGPLIASTPGLSVWTVVTSNSKRADAARRAHPEARVLSDVGELWQRAHDHDLAVIAAPNDAHAPLARRALDAGLAVVVDKPLAPTAAEARALVSAAESAWPRKRLAGHQSGINRLAVAAARRPGHRPRRSDRRPLRGR